MQVFAILRGLLPYAFCLQVLQIGIEISLAICAVAQLSLLTMHLLALAFYGLLVWQTFFDKPRLHFYVKFSSEIGTAVYALIQFSIMLTLVKLFPDFYIELW